MTGRHTRERGNCFNTSSTSQNMEEDAENTVNEQHVEDIVNFDQNLDLIDPGGLWFNDNKVKKKSREAITNMTLTFASTWANTTQHQKDNYWAYFRNQFKFHRKHEQVVRNGFERWCINRFPDIVRRVGQGYNKWMSQEVKDGMNKWRQSEKYIRNSTRRKIDSVVIQAGRLWQRTPWACEYHLVFKQPFKG